MVQTLSSLAFKGSITEAISEAKQQKKLFVVYVSGDNLESDNLETSTWTDSSVADSVLKFCILLHISEGSVDAANFSAIFPQKSAPCITAIGYNGIQLWQHEGFITSDVLASSIEKAWLSLHIQETTATFLTAALASEKQPASGTSDNALADEGSSSRTNVMLSETGTENDSADKRQSINYEIVQENNGPESAVKKTKYKIRDEASPGSSTGNKFENGVVKEDTSCTGAAKSSVAPADLNSTVDESRIQKENFSLVDHLFTAQEVSQGIANEANQGSQDTTKGVVSNELVIEANESFLEVNRHEHVVEKAYVVDFSASKSNDVHLNVRLPDGSSLHVKFSAMDTLRMVKDYVDENQTSSFGSYDLAIPYPRRVFSEQDFGQTLLELGLSNRQTLIVVLHRRANSHPKEGSSAHGFNQDGSSIRSNEGYWAYVRRVLSYMNPLSYLGGSSNSSETAQESQDSMWQHGPNSPLRNNLRGPGTHSSKPNASPTGGSSNRRSMQQSSSRFGSNIHTLKHDEDDSHFSDRNAFWNGNSTQFGGNNDGK